MIVRNFLAGKFRKPGFKDYLFFATTLIAQLSILHGKFLSLAIFGDGQVRFSDVRLDIHLVGLMGSCVLLVLITSATKPQMRIWAGSILALVSVSAMSTIRESVIISAMLLLFYAVAVIALFIDAYRSEKLDDEIWKLLFDTSIKGIQFMIAIFGIGMILLRYLSARIAEAPTGFLTTFTSASLSMTIIVFIFANWAIMPCWENYLSARKKQ